MEIDYLEQNKQTQEEKKLDKKEEFYLPIENSKRTILKIKKLENNNKRNKRNFAQIKKNPL